MSGVSNSKRAADAIAAVHKAFGAPGDYGYETAQGKALANLYAVAHTIRTAVKPDDAASLEDRLADCLAECIDKPLTILRDTTNDWPVEIHVGSYNQALAERAAGLLEEAGR